MRNNKLTKIFLLVVINTIIILGGTHAEYVPVVKSKPVEDLEKDDLPDHIFFASFLYQ